jgi:hypothetical protein
MNLHLAHEVLVFISVSRELGWFVSCFFGWLGSGFADNWIEFG